MISFQDILKPLLACKASIGNKKLFLVGLLLFASYLVRAQSSSFTEGYQPLVMNGNVPRDFIESMNSETEVEIQSQQAQSLSKSFRAATSFTLRDVFMSGNIYFNDALTTYVRGVANKLLANSQHKNHIKVYVSKFTTPNATSWQNGTIIINIGLLSLLENEDQLAFVLAHEVAHFDHQHAFKQFVHHNSGSMDASSQFGKLLPQLSYSHNHELQADKGALDLIKDSPFNAKEAVKALAILKRPTLGKAFDYKKYLSSKTHTISSKDLCSTYNTDKFKSPHGDSKHFSVRSIEARTNQINHLLPTDKNPYADYNKQKTQANFDKIRTISSFELVEQLYNEANYFRSIYQSLILIQRYPNNNFLVDKVAENLQQLSYYANNNGINKVIYDKYIYDRDYASLCCFFNKITLPTLNKIIIGFVNKQLDSYPQSEALNIVLAQVTENAYGQKSAKDHYRNYVEKFPRGKHLLLAKTKS